MPKKKKSSSADQSISFEESLAKLEQVVTDLESGEIGLDESLKCYEEGIQHIRKCRAELDRAEKKIEMLVSIDEEGRAEVQPLKESGSNVTGMSQKRSESNDSDDESSEDTLF